MLPTDEILIRELELLGSIGVTPEECSNPQRLVASLLLRPANSFQMVRDDLSRTVDYAAVCAELRCFVAASRHRLIETLAEEMAQHLLRNFPLVRVELELRKFVLPETRYVAVRLIREQPVSG